MDNENMFLVYALAMGIFITFIYDLLRIFRRIIPHGIFWVSVEDLGFWIYCAVKVFLLMYHESNGTLRWFAVLGALLGMWIYRVTLSPFLVKYLSLAGKKVVSILKKVLEIITRPARRLLKKWINHIRRLRQKTRYRKQQNQSRQGKALVKKKLTFLWKVLRMSI